MLETDDLTPDYQLVNEKQRAAEEALQRVAAGEATEHDHKTKEIDRDVVIKLARLHCSGRDIARWFGVHEDTIFARFREDIETAKAETRARLRNKMLEKAFARLPQGRKRLRFGYWRQRGLCQRACLKRQRCPAHRH